MESKREDSEIPSVRTIFDRRRHERLLPDGRGAKRIVVQPNHGNGLGLDLRGPSFQDLSNTVAPPQPPRKFVPKYASADMLVASFGKTRHRTEKTSSAYAQPTDDELIFQGPPMSVAETKGVGPQTGKLKRSDGAGDSDFDVCGDEEGEEFSDKAENQVPTSSSSSSRKSSGTGSSSDSDEEEVRISPAKDLPAQRFEEEQESTPVLPFESGSGDGSSTDDEKKANASSSEHMEDLIREHHELLKLFSVKQKDRAKLHLAGMNMDARPIENFYRIMNRADSGDLSFIKVCFGAALQDLKCFVKTPVAIGAVLRCRVVRNKKGMDRNMYPTYFLHMEDSKHGSAKILLLTARKRKKSTTSNYLLSVDPADLSRRGKSYVGKVRSNLIGTQFTIYDAGNSPKKFSFTSLGVDLFNYRQELGVVTYDHNVLGFKGPRKMKVIIPSMLGEWERCECRPDVEEETISEQIKKSMPVKTLIELQNKPPIWNTETQSYVLNFLGRVTLASVKNFQIIHEEKPDYVILQFGRIDDDNFTMDFRYPLCPLQAFAIAITSFDSKLACE